ncbi:MAG: phosphoribosylformylglycinamidine cyclo-ligase [Candidatus Levybacteria bacterium]|nr:phosphoribosylformylglycinamidine cyclo-ligase [Candidatus Levybacteria bacterium]
MASNESQPINYASTGVNYEAMDPFKRLAQLNARETSSNLKKMGMRVVESSRGESAFVWDRGDHYAAFVIEGLGTKNLVADAVREITGKTYYDQVAQDAVAMIVNDLIVVGAQPEVINMYVGSGTSDWFEDTERGKDLLEGWGKACDLAGTAWGGGESPTLKGVIVPNTGEILGAATGIIKPKTRLTLGDKLRSEDRVLLVESSGIHANGLTLARGITDNLPEGYATELPDGSTYGEALLTPTYIYAKLINDLFEQGIDIHYMVNITGHGWRKLMRAKEDFTYTINSIPAPHSVFHFIQEQSGNDDKEMYGNFNMGAGFAIFLPPKDVARAIEVARNNHSMHVLDAGFIRTGKRQVLIKPKNITFRGKTLSLR